MIKHQFKRSKYNVDLTATGKLARTVNGIVFDSQKEAYYYRELLVRQKSGDVLFFLRQVPFHLPGGVVFRCDFQEFTLSGEVHFVDVKGYRTKSYIRNKKQVEALYPIKIYEV